MVANDEYLFQNRLLAGIQGRLYGGRVGHDGESEWLREDHGQRAAVGEEWRGRNDVSVGGLETGLLG